MARVVIRRERPGDHPLVRGHPDDQVRGRSKEREIARSENLSDRFRPDEYRDEYRVGLEELIARKQNGEQRSAKRRKPEPKVTDLMETLQRSVEASRTPRRSAARPVRKARSPARLGPPGAGPMKGDRVEAVVDTGQGWVQTFEVVATRASRRIEVTTARGIVEVTEVTRSGTPVRTGRFMASRLVALVEHPALEGRKTIVEVTTKRRLGSKGLSPRAWKARAWA